MYTKKTYQDYLTADNKPFFIANCIKEYKGSRFFKLACKSEQYFNGETDIMNAVRKTIMRKYERIDDTGEMTPTAHEVSYNNNHISNNFIKRFVTQEVQYLLNNGLRADFDKYSEFGKNIDYVIQKSAEKAILHGETALFWNNGNLELFPLASKNGFSGMFFLQDESDSTIRLGVRFWQLNAEKPLYFEIYDEQGIFTYTINERQNRPILQAQRAYIKRKTETAIGVKVEDVKLGYLPFVILRADEYGQGILSDNIKTKIDLYDKILSDFGDNMERLEGIYWAIKNFGGTVEQARCMLADIEKYKMAINQGDMSAEPSSIEAPFNARKFALELLERELYRDCMALNFDEITGTSLTNIAIYTAKANLDMKCNALEYQIFDMLARLTDLIGKPDMFQKIQNFQRMDIANKSEIVRDIYIMRNDISRRKALELNPYIDDDEIQELLNEADTEDMGIDELPEVSR